MVWSDSSATHVAHAHRPTTVFAVSPRLLLLALLLTSCLTGEPVPRASADLAPLDLPALTTRLETGGRPTVVNVWASWCIPCRSETPLLVEAHAVYGERIDFIGVDVQDSQDEATRFIEDFGVPYENLFDPGATFRQEYGGAGVPVTYFFTADGDLFDTHIGVIDEGQLVLALDELLAN